MYVTSEFKNKSTLHNLIQYLDHARGFIAGSHIYDSIIKISTPDFLKHTDEHEMAQLVSNCRAIIDCVDTHRLAIIEDRIVKKEGA